MASRKHNEFLDAGDSDSDSDQGEGYISAHEDVPKGGRHAKRQKLGPAASDASQPDEGQDAVETSEPTTQPAAKIELPGLSKPLTKENLIATTTALKRSGVVYLSRVPPFMKPTKLRSLLEPYGRINRIFLTPEDPQSHSRRVRHGGNKKRSFVDGWVEFVNKVEAKAVCELLNGRSIGGKKGTFYHDNVWNLLYLRGFKWTNLTAQILAENAERASRMRAEIAKATKENKEFVRNVERAKMLEGMEAKKAAKQKIDTATVADERAEKGGKRDHSGARRRPMKFQQIPVAVTTRPGDQPEQVMKVLSKIF